MVELATWASICPSSAFRPPARPLDAIVPSSHLLWNAWSIVWLAEPIAVIGSVWVCGLPKIFRNVANFGFAVSFGSFSAVVIVGTFPRPLASCSIAPVLNARYFASSQEAPGFEDPFGIPITLPVV